MPNSHTTQGTSGRRSKTDWQRALRTCARNLHNSHERSTRRKSNAPMSWSTMLASHRSYASCSRLGRPYLSATIMTLRCSPRCRLDQLHCRAQQPDIPMYRYSGACPQMPRGRPRVAQSFHRYRVYLGLRLRTESLLKVGRSDTERCGAL